MENALLRIEDFTVQRNYQPVFEPYWFTLSAGESLYLKGANGAGKTTSLRVLAGISQQYRGKIFLNEIERRELLHHYPRSIIYVGHALSLNYDLSARENLASILAIRGQTLSENECNEVFETLNIPQHDRPIRYLSAGQKRRVALSRLWFEDRPIWILDEPFTALDVGSIELLEAKMATHIETGGMIIFTSHQAPSDCVFTKTLTVEAKTR